jgi:hypothetical protein
MNLKPCVRPWNITTKFHQWDGGIKTQASAGKAMASFLATHMVLHDFLEPGTIINSQHYTATLKTLETVIYKSLQAQEERFAAT